MNNTFLSYDQYLNEKFSDDSDPVKDLGIGKFEVGDTVKLKDGLKYIDLHTAKIKDKIIDMPGSLQIWPEMIIPDECIIVDISYNGNFLLKDSNKDIKYYYPKTILDLVKKHDEVNEK